MGKKFGVNAKAEEGRARKAAASEEKKRKEEARKEAEETHKWSQGAYRNKKKEEEESKRLEKLAKKKEREEQERRERAELDRMKPPRGAEAAAAKRSAKAAPSSPSIAPQTERSIAADALRGASATLSSTLDDHSDASDQLETYSASNIDDAVSLLGSLAVEPDSGAMERHPERRMKAAWSAYVERELPALRHENPTLRLSQLKERLYQQWRRAPENPYNQPHIAHTASREEERQALREHAKTELERFKNVSPGPR